VLGAGGPLGAAWMIGALCALDESRDFDVRTCEVVIGTSAGAVIGALLAGGARPAELRDHLLGVPSAGGPLAGAAFDYGATGGILPPLPQARIGSPALLARWLRSPWRYSPVVALSAVAPPGRASLQSVREIVGSVRSPDGWSAHSGLHVVAMDYDTGDRAVFAPDHRPADLADAVTASCAVPSWFPPVEIEGRQYVDGGVLSATHADLALDLGLDEVYVLAPLAAEEPDPATPPAWQRLVRGAMRRRLLREAALLQENGTEPILITPSAADLEAMGPNLMDPSRRVAVLRTSLTSTAATLAEAGAKRLPRSA
jgi:NTE family protein